MQIRATSSKLRKRGAGPAGATPGPALAAATTLTLTDIAVDGTIMQRAAGQTYKDVLVPFTYTGTASIVQARAVDSTSGAEVVPWTTIATNPTGGAGSGKLRIPQAKWCKLQIRDGINTALVSNGANEFVVGKIIVWWGQSNTVNSWSTAEKYPIGSKNARGYNAAASPQIKHKRLGNHATSGTDPAVYTMFGQAGYPASFADDITRSDAPTYYANMQAQALGVPVLLVLSAYGGQSIDTWVPTSGSHWADLSAAIATVGGDIEEMVCLQGESDAHTKTASAMRSAWDGLQSQTLTVLAPFGRNTSNFKMGMISLGPGNYGGSTSGEFGAMRANQASYSQSTAGWYYAGSMYDGATVSDQVHVDGVTHSCAYRRACLSSLAYVHGVGVSGAGPKLDPTGTSRAGSVITCNVIHAGGTALLDGAGGTGGSVTSLEVKDSTGAVIAHTLSVTGAAQFKLTLSGSFTAPLTLSNALADTPCGAYSGSAISFTPAACLYDNISYVNGTRGAPLQPCAAFAVS